MKGFKEGEIAIFTPDPNTQPRMHWLLSSRPARFPTWEMDHIGVGQRSVPEVSSTMTLDESLKTLRAHYIATARHPDVPGAVAVAEALSVSLNYIDGVAWSVKRMADALLVPISFEEAMAQAVEAGITAGTFSKPVEPPFRQEVAPAVDTFDAMEELENRGPDYKVPSFNEMAQIAKKGEGDENDKGLEVVLGAIKIEDE